MHGHKQCGPGAGRGEWARGPERRRAFFGPGGDFGGPRGRGRRARRGDIRTAALMLLAEEPRNGYQIMQEVEERSGGLWRPSPGSVYPALQQLLDEGLIREQEIDGRRGYALTDEGKAVVDGRPADAPTPWETVGGAGAGEMHDLARLAREVAGACALLMRTGSPTQLERAKEVLATARRELYTILADGEQPKG